MLKSGRAKMRMKQSQVGCRKKDGFSNVMNLGYLYRKVNLTAQRFP